MTLRKWMKDRKISVKAFAQLIKRDRSYIHMLLRGIIPSDKVMKRISQVTRAEISKKEDLADGERNLHKNER